MMLIKRRIWGYIIYSSSVACPYNIMASTRESSDKVKVGWWRHVVYLTHQYLAAACFKSFIPPHKSQQLLIKSWTSGLAGSARRVFIKTATSWAGKRPGKASRQLSTIHSTTERQSTALTSWYDGMSWGSDSDPRPRSWSSFSFSIRARSIWGREEFEASRMWHTRLFNAMREFRSCWW